MVTQKSLAICIQTKKMHKILVIRLYLPLDALHVSDCISPSSGANFIWHIPAYTSIYQIQCTAHKICS